MSNLLTNIYIIEAPYLVHPRPPAGPPSIPRQYVAAVHTRVNYTRPHTHLISNRTIIFLYCVPLNFCCPFFSFSLINACFSITIPWMTKFEKTCHQVLEKRVFHVPVFLLASEYGIFVHNCIKKYFLPIYEISRNSTTKNVISFGFLLIRQAENRCGSGSNIIYEFALIPPNTLYREILCRVSKVSVSVSVPKSVSV